MEVQRNLNECIKSIHYAEKSINNTTIGYRLENNTLFLKYAEKGLKELCDIVNSQLKLCRENSVDDS